MKLIYDKKALKKAAKYLFKKNPLSFQSPEEIETTILKDIRTTAHRNNMYIISGRDDWIRMTGTMGYYLNFSLEEDYIQCDVLVQPSFGDADVVEGEL